MNVPVVPFMAMVVTMIMTMPMTVAVVVTAIVSMVTMVMAVVTTVVAMGAMVTMVTVVVVMVMMAVAVAAGSRIGHSRTTSCCSGRGIRRRLFHNASWCMAIVVDVEEAHFALWYR